MDVVRTLVTIAVGDHEIVCANTIADLGEQLLRITRPLDCCVILYSDYPQADVLPAYTAIGSPLVICADDFRTIAHYSVVSRAYGGVDAARFASMGLVNIEPVISAPPDLSLVVNDSATRLSEFVVRLAQLYGLPLDERALQRVLGALGQTESSDESLDSYGARTLPSHSTARARLERRSPLENELIDLLASQYGPIAAGERLERLEWPPFALLRPDFPDRLTVGSIDLTGPARFIYYGPYFALPLGCWRADLVLEVSNCLSDNQIAIDVVSGGVLAAIKAKLPPEGVFGCAIPFEIRTPANPVEIRVQLLTGAIEGLLMLRSVHLTLIASPSGGRLPSEAAS
jgi:hypothetical protein